MNWGWITDNWAWKIGSLLLAVALWYALARDANVLTSQTFPVLYKNLPPELIIGPDAPDRVQFELRGPASRLTTASLAESSALIDLAEVRGPGEYTFTLTGANLNVPRGVHFLRAVPSQFRLRFDRLLTREVPVQVRFSGPPPEGYRVVTQSVVPGRLRIAGPEPRVRLVESAQTDAIDLSGTVATSEFRVHTYVADPQVRLESSPVVSVRVVVAKKDSGRE